jgi:two-component system, NtrC family, nitrogen regulation sensor histidine kinase NtrY
MVPKLKRNPELTRLYVAVGLLVLIWILFSIYKLLSAQVSVGIDAPSRWALLALGLANVLAIGTLLFIVARSLAKLYFERRSGILGSRLRTRLVLALLAVGIAPSLMLFLVGRNFIAKNVDRWFQPETQNLLLYSQTISDAYRNLVKQRLEEGTRRVPPASTEDLTVLRERAGLDLLARTGPGLFPAVNLAPGHQYPPLPSFHDDRNQAETIQGTWFFQTIGDSRHGYIAGVMMPRKESDCLTLLNKQYLEAFQIHAIRDTLETLPQSTFLFLTLLTLFAAVWVGLAISRTISEPVRALAKAAQRVGTGDLDVSLPEEGGDELAFLARSFNTMIRDLKQGRMAIEAQAERIESNRQYLGQLLEALPVGVMSWTKEGNIRTFNPTARRWFGLEDWDQFQSEWKELEGQPRMGGLPELVTEVYESRRARQEELRLGTEGESRPVRAMVLPLTNGGVLAVLEDLSLLAQAEKRAAWQEVARRMAHEVKNPLTPIKLTAQRLLRRSKEGRLDTDLVAEATETILAEVLSLSRLVDSFSRFAKLPVPQPTPLDACDLVRQVEALYAPVHPRIRFELSLPDNPVEARWDSDMVRRALINLVDNAVSAIEGPGTIRLSLTVDGHRVQMQVQDSGSGVPEEDRDRLFEPYFSTKKKGTGLGLAIVRRIAQDHGGDASYEALPQGSMFCLELPMGRKANHESHE